MTGLDPAGIQHTYVPANLRLDKSDAVQVDVIHTDANGFGTKSVWETVGHIDFFPNGGERQPGCTFAKNGKLSSRLGKWRCPLYQLS